MVCERWCVTKWCVKDVVSMMVCDEVPHCQHSATRATPATQMEGQCLQVPRLPRKVARRPGRATPATRNEGGCHQVPRLPRLPRKVARRPRRPSTPKLATRASPLLQVARLARETKLDVTKCHACHAKRRWMSPSAMPATHNEGGCHQVPCLPC